MLSNQIIEMCFVSRGYESSTNDVNDMYYNGRSNKSWQRIVEYSPYHLSWQRIEYSPDQIKINPVEKHLYTQVVEYLILLWMSQVTTCQNKQLVDFKKNKEFLSQIKSRPNGGNIFLERVAFVGSDRNDESTLKASINLAGDIKEIKFRPHDMKKDDVDAGMVVLKGRYFDIEIKYERQNKFSYSA
jgi:hypothetical protein